MAASFGSVVVPHFKGHRLRALAEHQLATGSPGLEASKLTDIIQLYRAGLDCEFTLSWCWNRPVTWDCAAALVAEGATLVVDVDSDEMAAGYAAAAAARGVTLGVRLQVHSGLRGIAPKKAPDLARTVISTPGLELTALTAYRGIYTSTGSFNDRPPEELGREEGELLVSIAEELTDDVDRLSIICGSSITSRGAASTAGVTGVAGGTYAVADLTQALLGFCEPENNALGTVVTVLETDGDLATIDAGLRHLGSFSHYPPDIPDIVHSATMNGEIVLVQAGATSGQVRRQKGPPMVKGQRLVLLPGNASAFAAQAGAVIVVDDSGTVIDAWARLTNDIRIDDVLI